MPRTALLRTRQAITKATIPMATARRARRESGKTKPESPMTTLHIHLSDRVVAFTDGAVAPYRRRVGDIYLHCFCVVRRGDEHPIGRPRAARTPKRTPIPIAPAETRPKRQCICATVITIPINPPMTHTALRLHAATLSALLNGPRRTTTFSPFANAALTGRSGLPRSCGDGRSDPMRRPCSATARRAPRTSLRTK